MTRATETLLRIAVVAMAAAPVELVVWRMESLGGHIDVGAVLWNVFTALLVCGFIAAKLLWPLLPGILMLAGLAMFCRAFER